MILSPGDPSDRAGHCGGTDAAAIICALEEVPYFAGLGEWSVWASQIHPELLPEPSAELQARWAMGHHLEEPVLRRYDREVATPNGLRCDVEGGYAEAEGTPYRAQVDGLLVDDPRLVGVVDAKSTERPWAFREFVRDDGAWSVREIVPRGYEVQLVWQMALLRSLGHPIEVASLAVLDRTSAPWRIDDDRVVVDIDAAKLLTRDVLWDATEADYILRTVDAWWQRHIIGGEEPPDDSSDVARRWRLAGKSAGHSERAAAPDEVALIREWDAAGKFERESKAERKRLGTAILHSMDVSRLTVGAGRVQINRTRYGLTLAGYHLHFED